MASPARRRVEEPGEARVTAADLQRHAAGEEDAKIAALLGRKPQGRYEVIERDGAGEPVVIRNAPLLDDGTPMPTRYWLVHRGLRERVGRLESTGGVRRAEAAVDPAAIETAHRQYAAERDAAIPEGWTGPRPSGGVGGTRKGVKCLHAHLAWYLAGGDDPVGRWVAGELASGELASGELAPGDSAPGRRPPGRPVPGGAQSRREPRVPR